MPKTKKIPMRMCIACREMQPKSDMTRVVKTVEGEIKLDPTGKAAGRGAYVCGKEECLKKFTGKKLLHKAFSADVPMDVYDGIGGERLGK